MLEGWLIVSTGSASRNPGILPDGSKYRYLGYLRGRLILPFTDYNDAEVALDDIDDVQ